MSNTANLLQSLPSLASIVDRQPLTVDPDMPLIEVISLMSQAKGRNCLLPDTGVSSASATPLAQSFSPNNTPHQSAVLVLVNDRLVGIFTERDLVKLTASQCSLQYVKVGEVMTTELQTLVLSDCHTVMSALTIFQQHQIRHLPILNDRQRLIGIVTPEHIRQILQPSDSLWSAQQIMESKQIRRLVITNERGELAGILTQSNLLQLLDPLEMLYMLEQLQQQTIDRGAELEQSNRELRLEVIRRQQIEDDLERRVQERTVELNLRTQQLQAEIVKHEFQKYALDRSAIVAATDLHGTVISVNENFCEISQYSSDELIGKTHRLINSGYHPPEFFQQLWATIASGQIWRGEVKNRAKDGSYYWVATTIVPCLDDGGQPFQYLSISCDITSRKQAEELLRDSELKFRAIFDNIATAGEIRTVKLVTVQTRLFQKVGFVS